MQPQRWRDYGTAVPVIAGIVDVLQAKRWINPAPHVERLVALNNVLASVVQLAIAEKKTHAAEREVLLVATRDAVRNERQTSAVKFPAPPPATSANADFCRLIHFGIRERFVLALVPSPPAEHSHPLMERLFEIDTESVLDR